MYLFTSKLPLLGVGLGWLVVEVMTMLMEMISMVMTIAGKYFALYRSRGLSEGKRKESLFIPRHPTIAL